MLFPCHFKTIQIWYKTILAFFLALEARGLHSVFAFAGAAGLPHRRGANDAVAEVPGNGAALACATIALP